MRTIPLVVALGLVAATLAAPGQARADGQLTLFGGSSFAGDSDAGTGTLGVSLAAVGGLFALEADLSTTRSIFGTRATLGDNRVTTAMVNLQLGLPLGIVRPYVLAGAGLIRTTVDGPAGVSARRNDGGATVGGGIDVFITDHVGIRGDVRYFRTLSEDGSLLDFDLDLNRVDFWRGTGGVSFRW